MGTPTVDLIDLNNNQDNIKRIMRVFTNAQWDDLFSKSNSVYQYEEFLKGAWKYPYFCNENLISTESLDETCKRELAGIFAHYAQETGMHSTWEDVPEWKQGLFYLHEIGCGEQPVCTGYTAAGHAYYPPVAGKTYHGRGSKQLSWNYNYGQFSFAIFRNKDVLLQDPDRVASEGWLALGSSIWFYMTPQYPKPSMHDVMAGFWQPNNKDLSMNLKSGFGATINIINGAQECNMSTNQAATRIVYFNELLNYFGVTDPYPSGQNCIGMKSFVDGGSSAFEMYYEQDWADTSKCRFSKWFTEWSIFEENGYGRCIEHFNSSGTSTSGGTSTGSTSGSTYSFTYLFLETIISDLIYKYNIIINRSSIYLSSIIIFIINTIHS